MSIYTALVNGTPTLVFNYHGPLDHLEFDTSEHDTIRQVLCCQDGADGRPLYASDDENCLTFREASLLEINKYRDGVDDIEADYKMEGWADFDPDEFVIFLVHATDCCADDDEEEAA